MYGREVCLFKYQVVIQSTLDGKTEVITQWNSVQLLRCRIVFCLVAYKDAGAHAYVHGCHRTQPLIYIYNPVSSLLHIK